MKILKNWLKYLIPFTLGVLIYSFVTQYDRTIALFSDVFGGFFYLVTRFLIGFGVAYFLNFPMRFIEKTFKFKRWLSIIVTYIIALGFLTLIIWFVIPSLVDSVRQILSTGQTYYIQIQELLNRLSVAIPESARGTVDDVLVNASKSIMDYLSTLLSMDNIGSTLTNIVSSSVRTLMNIMFGLFISFYALWDKEKLMKSMKRFLYAILPNNRVEGAVGVCKDADHNFSRFLIGKFWESVLVGILSLILYLIFRLPVPVFLAFLAGVTNMIPIFGPIAGGAITGIILLGFGPVEMLVGVLICIAMQTLDGAVLGPKILGNAFGMSPILVIISITVGGDLFGIPGIILGVPVVVTIKHILINKFFKRRLRDKGIDDDEEIEGQIKME